MKRLLVSKLSNLYVTVLFQTNSRLLAASLNTKRFYCFTNPIKHKKGFGFKEQLREKRKTCAVRIGFNILILQSHTNKLRSVSDLESLT